MEFAQNGGTIMLRRSLSSIGLGCGLAIWIYPACCLASTSYYFAAAGGDGNSCTSPSAPCRTVSKMNALMYVAGDSIHFHGGDKFSGCVVLNRTNVRGKGSSSNPITLESYGEGAAMLLSTCPGKKKALLTIDGISGVVVQGLALSSNGTETAFGILVENSIAGNVSDTVVIRNNDISGFNIGGTEYGAEVFIAGLAGNGNCGALNNVQVVGNKLHGAMGPASLDDNGITGYGCGQNITNVKYSGNEVYHIGGHRPAPGGTSGNGIIAGAVNGGELSFNVVHDNGANVATCGGPAGVWAYRANNIVISSNEVFKMRPLPNYPGGGACDWAAYDLDSGVTNSIVEYNYSHDNAGPGLLAYIGEKWGQNTFRYNISENDNTMMVGGSGSVSLNGGGVLYVYNNTIFRSGKYDGTTAPSCIYFGYSGKFSKESVVANNLCVNSMKDRFGHSSYLDSGSGVDVSDITVANNLYYNPEGQHRWRWQNIEHSTLSSFQAGSAKDANARVANPDLAGFPGGGEACVATEPAAKTTRLCPSAYRLKGGSMAIGVGQDLSRPPYNLNVGARDYYGLDVPQKNGTGFNIGAAGSDP
jgi:hypothetical protein